MPNYATNAVGSYDNMTATGAQEIRTTEVQSELHQLVTVSEYLDKCIGELETKLQPVLAQHKVETTSDQNSPTPLRVPLAETLHIRCEHLENLRERVSSMIARLEL